MLMINVGALKSKHVPGALHTVWSSVGGENIDAVKETVIAIQGKDQINGSWLINTKPREYLVLALSTKMNIYID